jgi:hypothetical protein
LQVKKEEDAAKEALDGTALAEFFFGPGWWQAGAVLVAFGIPGDDRDSVEARMDPSNEAQAPIGVVRGFNGRSW